MGPAELKEQVATGLLELMEVGMGLVGLAEREESLKEREKSVLRLEREMEVLKRSQRRLQADLAEERERRGVAEVKVKALEGQGLDLMNRVRDLKDDKNEGEAKMKELKEVRDFWAEEGAEQVVRKCLDSDAFFAWFVDYSKLVRKVGYCAGVEQVFAQCKDRLGNYRIIEMKGYKILDATAGDLINQAYSRLQSGEIQFPILEALASNPGLNADQLRNIEKLAEPGLGGAGTTGGVSVSAGGKRSASVPPSGSEASKKARTISSGFAGSTESSTLVEEIVVEEAEEEATGEDLTREEKEDLVDRTEETLGTGGVPEGGGGQPPEGTEGGDGAEMP